MGRSITVTDGEAEALTEARFRFRADTVSKLLRAALDGDPVALGHIRDTWPRKSESELAREKLAKLRKLRRTAARALNIEEHGRLSDEIELVMANAHNDGVHVGPRKGRRIHLDHDVVDRLLLLASKAPSTGSGRPAAALGVRVMLNEADDA